MSRSKDMCNLTWDAALRDMGTKLKQLWEFICKILWWNNLEGVQKPPSKKVVCINATCVGMPTWNNQMKVQGLGLICNFFKK